MEPHVRLNLWYLVLALIGIMYLHDLWLTMRQVESIPYSEFVAQLQQGNVAEVQVGAKHLAGKLKRPLPDGRSQFVTTRVDGDIANLLAKPGVAFSGIEESTWLRDLLGWILPAAIFVALWMFVIRRYAEQ